MNGFLIYASTNNLGHENSVNYRPFIKNDINILYVTNYIIVFTNKKALNDIHISSKQNDSFLILSGYISESTLFPNIKTQQELCDRIRTYLDISSRHSIKNLASSLYGSFALVYICNNNREVITITDRVASRPLWFQKDNTGLRISTHAIAIARHKGSVRMSPGSLASYILYATQVEPTHSLYDGILSQKEGTIGIFHEQNSRTEIPWYRFQHIPDDKRPVSSWVELATDRFKMAASRILKTTTKPLVFLSGGVDSRITGAALISAGATPLLCTLGDSINLETRIAKMVAASFHCRHIIKLRDDEWYLRGLPTAMFQSSGCFSWIHSHFHEAYISLQQSHQIDSAFLGDFNEAFSKLLCSCPPDLAQLPWSPSEFYNNFDSLPLKNYRPINKSRTIDLLSRDIRDISMAALKEKILNRYSEVSTVSKDPLIVADYFFRWQSASCTPTFQMFCDVRSAGPERNLMFDKDLHQLLEIMPAKLRRQGSLGTKIVHKLCPKAAWVPNANTLLPLPVPQLVQNLAKMARPKLGKLRRKMLSNTYRTTASWPHLPLLYANQVAWKKQIEEKLFHADALSPEYFDRKSMASCWNDFCKGDLSRHADIERLVGLAELSLLTK